MDFSRNLILYRSGLGLLMGKLRQFLTELICPRHDNGGILSFPLRKHAYSNILKLLPSKIENFQMKTSDEAVLTSTHNLCFLSRNKKNNVCPCKPQFYHIKVGFKGVKII